MLSSMPEGRRGAAQPVRHGQEGATHLSRPGELVSRACQVKALALYFTCTHLDLAHPISALLFASIFPLKTLFALHDFNANFGLTTMTMPRTKQPHQLADASNPRTSLADCVVCFVDSKQASVVKHHEGLPGTYAELAQAITDR